MSKIIDEMSRQLKDLNAKREAILAKSGPLRQVRDDHVNAAREIENRMNAEIKEIEKDMFEIDNDRSALARALGGRRMSDGATDK